MSKRTQGPETPGQTDRSYAPPIDPANYGLDAESASYGDRCSIDLTDLGSLIGETAAQEHIQRVSSRRKLRSQSARGIGKGAFGTMIR